MVRQLGIRIVFSFHNFYYLDASMFMPGDCIAVPPAFAQAFYRKTPGLECRILPYVIDRARVMVTKRQPRYASFVNPQTTKGLFVFARIAEVLAWRGPTFRPATTASRQHRGQTGTAYFRTRE
jgi:hypothetical protein